MGVHPFGDTTVVLTLPERIGGSGGSGGMGPGKAPIKSHK